MKLSKAIAVSLVGTTLIFIIHYLGDSMLNEPDHFLKSVVEYHEKNDTFSKRKLNSLLIKSTSQIFNISIKNSFSLINYILLVISGLLVFNLSFNYPVNY